MLSPNDAMRAVLDTNVVVSGLIWDGAPSTLLKAAAACEFVVHTSPALLEELKAVLARKHLRERLARRGASVDEAIEAYGRLAVLVVPGRVAREVPRDPDDDQVVAAAVTARADLIVSGDKHLLQLGAAGGIPVLAPAAAVGMLHLAAPG